MDIFIESERISQIDKKINSDVTGVKLENHLFLRLVAKGKKFTNVTFRYAIFDNCYLRDCAFDSCDFTGCKFIGSNFRGTTFSGCKFDYATFERTNISSDILDTECPAFENLKQFFARSLRTNYQQIGDSASVNKSIRVELQATNVHLYKEWNSNESYYRKKYKGVARIRSFSRWVEFKFLDFVWGNGESLAKMVRAVILVLILMACWDVHTTGKEFSFSNLLSSIYVAPSIFLGISLPEKHSTLYVSIITLIRLITLGFLISIIIKRFNRR